MQDQGIVITTCEISANKDDLYNGVQEDKRLNAVMDKFIEGLIKRDIEIFERNNNIIITEKGYFLVFYAKDLKKIK